MGYICSSPTDDPTQELRIYNEDPAIFEPHSENFACEGTKDSETIEQER